MKKTFPQFEANTTSPFCAPYVEIDGKMTCICEEISLWTYWQGLDYAKKTPKIKYLVVGQDFGNIFNGDNKRIMEINAGKKIFLISTKLIILQIII